MELRKEIQQSAVAGEVQALIAAARPILFGLLLSLKQQVANDFGGHDSVLLRQLARNRRPNDGDCGVCFEYLVHDAILNGDPGVIERINHALHRYCRIRGGDPASLLFGAEKSGIINLIASIKENLTDDSNLLAGSRGRPVRLKRHIDAVAAAFRRSQIRDKLPASISGLWKADLFVGRPQPDQWVGTTVKINRAHLQGARGLRLAIVPSEQGVSDAIFLDEMKNLIVVPMPYDGAFMEVFYTAWETVIQFLYSDARMPKAVLLPRPAPRHLAALLEARREFSVMEVIAALSPLAQPYLLDTQPMQLELDLYRPSEIQEVTTLFCPFARPVRRR